MELVELPSVLIHVGFHKTASSLLQEEFFSQTKLGFSQYPRASSFELAHHKLAGLNPFDNLESQTINELHQFARSAAQKNLLPVISHERLSGYPASGGFDSKLILERLKDIFPNAKILIIIREQNSLIQSVYSQIISDGGGYSLKEFLSSIEPRKMRIPQFQLSFYEFDKYINCCQTLFGREQTLVLPYELLLKNHQEFFDRIGVFAFGNDWEKSGRFQELPRNTVVNYRRPILLQNIARVVNSVFYKNQLSNSALTQVKDLPKKLEHLAPFVKAITPKIIERNLSKKNKKIISEYVGAYYSDSNLKTSKLININLAEYNYLINHNPSKDRKDR